MREKFTDNVLGYILKYYSYEEKNLDKLKYGLECFYSFITKLSLVLLMALILGTIKETFLLLSFYGLLRSFAFGIHASSSMRCWIITLPIYGLVPFLSKILVFSDTEVALILIITMISFILYAPADTHKRPIINSKKRAIGKMMTLFLFLIFQIIVLTTSNNLIINTILIALIIQAIVINPLFYKLFKMPYANYKTYVKKV